MNETLIGPESTFLDECAEHLSSVETHLLQVDGTPDPETVNSLFRSFHSIKGAAEVFGHEHVGQFTHRVESLLVRVRDGELAFNRGMSRVLLEATDHVRRLLAAGSNGGADTDLAHKTQMILAEIKALDGVEPPHHNGSVSDVPSGGIESISSYTISLRSAPEMFRRGLDFLPVVRYLAKHGTISNVECLTDQIPDTDDFDPETAFLGLSFQFATAQPGILDDAFEFIREDCAVEVAQITQSPAPPSAQTQPEPLEHAAPAVASRSFRVDAEKIDGLVDLVGELVTSGAEIGTIADALKSEMLAEAGHRLTRTITEIRERTLRLRMVSIEMVFGRLRRAVHDTAEALHKKVHMSTRGGDIQFDRTLVERVTDPLMHIVRNAVDHAIEPQEERVAAGKSPEGLIELAAYNQGGDVVIEIRDDGRGLRKDRILARAVSKGLIASGSMPSEEEIINFIFAPGFSTAETVTQISGRGVGLDVVRRNIESLGGAVEVSTTPGSGSVFTVRIPLTLATIDGFMVGLGDVRYVISMDIVKECIAFEDINERDFVNLRGDVIPFVDLRRLLGFTPGKTAYLVIVHADKQLIGLVVDHIYGEIQAVVKPLGLLRTQTRGLSGFSVLGSGAVAPILDIPAICALAKEREQFRIERGIVK